MRCVLLTGGNAAGKTTALKAAYERHKDLPGWRWIYADHEINGKAGSQYRTLLRVWTDPTVEGIAIEGVRIYSAVYRCAAFSVVKRTLWVAMLLQDYETGRLHIQQRCARSGKQYRASFWDRDVKEVGDLFNGRYVAGTNKFLRECGHLADVREVAQFWIDRDYRQLVEVGQWLDRVIHPVPGPGFPRNWEDR